MNCPCWCRANLKIPTSPDCLLLMELHSAHMMSNTKEDASPGQTDRSWTISRMKSSPQGKRLLAEWNGGDWKVDCAPERYFKEKEVLGASFFFKWDKGNRGNAKRFFRPLLKDYRPPFLRWHSGFPLSSLKNLMERSYSGSSSERSFFNPCAAWMSQSEASGWPWLIHWMNATDVLLQLLPQLQNRSSMRLNVFWQGGLSYQSKLA